MSEKQRMHPLGIVEYLLRNVIVIVQAAFPVSVALFSLKLSGYVLLAIAGIIALYGAYAVLNWLRFVYYVENEELQVEQGVLVRKSIHIPIERIQSIRISAGVVQRIIGVVKLEVETAGSNAKADVTLPALSRIQAERLRQALEHGKGDAKAEDRALIEYRLSVKSLLIAASTTNGLWLAVLGLFALFSQIDQFLPIGNVYEFLGRSAVGLTGSGIVVIAAVLLVVLAAAWLLSLVGSVISLGGYRLVRDGDVLRISRGLLNRDQYMLPVKRIQAITIDEGILRQAFGFASISAISAGLTEKGSMSSTLFPLLRRSEVDDFLCHVAPEFVAKARLERARPASIFSYIARLLIPVLAGTVAISLLVPSGYLALLLLVPAALLAYGQYRDAGWSLEGDLLAIRARGIGLKTYRIPGGKIQSASVSQSYFQKPRKLVTVSIMIPSSLGPVTAGVLGLSEAQGQAIHGWFGSRFSRHPDTAAATFGSEARGMASDIPEPVA